MSLQSLRARISRAAGAVPQPLPEVGTSTAVVDLLLSEAVVLGALERWASKRPGFEPMEPPTVLHQPDAADIRMAAQDPRLACLAEKSLTHAPGIVDARLSRLFAEYENAREPDEAIERAVGDAGEQLTSLLASGVDIPAWCADRIAILQRCAQ